MFPEAYIKDINTAIAILKEEGCSEVFVFGSLADDILVHDHSDIDIAVRGLRRERFFAAYGRLLSQLEHSVDLVDLDGATPFSQLLLRAGTLRRVA